MQSQFRMIDKPEGTPGEPSVVFSREVLDDECPDLSFLQQDYAEESPEDAAKYKDQDGHRLDGFSRGDWYMVGVRAKADIQIWAGGNSFACYTLTSPGVWGIESDSGEDFLEEVYQDQLAELKNHLAAMAEAFAVITKDNG